MRGEPVFPDGEGGYTAQTNLCPRRMVTDESVFLMSLFSHYRAGHLYQAGGVRDQPARYLQAMQFIEGVVNDDNRES